MHNNVIKLIIINMKYRQIEEVWMCFDHRAIHQCQRKSQTNLIKVQE